MRATESRKEVVQRILVGYIDRRQVEIELEAFLMQDILLADGNVEEVARRNARRREGRLAARDRSPRFNGLQR